MPNDLGVPVTCSCTTGLDLCMLGNTAFQGLGCGCWTAPLSAPGALHRFRSCLPPVDRTVDIAVDIVVDNYVD